MRGFSRRGQPLVALVMVLGGWVSARAMMWDPAGVPSVKAPVQSVVAALAMPARRHQQSMAVVDAGHPVAVLEPALAELDGTGTAATAMLADQADRALAKPSGFADQSDPDPAPLPAQATAPTPPIQSPRLVRQIVPLPPAAVSYRVPVAIAAGHQLLWMAALSQIPMPAVLLGLPDPAPTPVPFYPAGSQPRGNSNRWSVDSWVLWRRGSNGAPSGGLLTPSYGASQAGAVLRYRLSPGSSLRPALYLRTTAALGSSGEREAALGLSLRPLARLPLSLQGEARFTSTPSGHALRPAVLAVTELPPFAMPLGLRGEAYGQAGYVGGKFATGFADGQLRLDHRVLKLGRADVRFGGGAWGGIQKGASRIDAGPSLTIGQPLGGPASIRLGADWRFRVAGRAAPGSGPAVTLSAGF